MVTDFLLCVLIAQLAFIAGDIAGKQPDMQDRQSRSLVTVMSLIGSLSLGALLYFAVWFIAKLLNGAL